MKRVLYKCLSISPAAPSPCNIDSLGKDCVCGVEEGAEHVCCVARIKYNSVARLFFMILVQSGFIIQY